ncbi:hypothetical protein K503DRAFT_862515 [Rhizopogon vinicolor AM-OR11-026]|uniref:DUF1275 domain protein n=1 Tax=Rhizopogon vinicolor AM-OR11-026 TaxID=1314800 RepID=A0A1B7NE33_9AGAM|nr:hypothetical protein K503DRAFT_862515 [Rhizopogon vinicolor AM-OR11-026]
MATFIDMGITDKMSVESPLPVLQKKAPWSSMRETMPDFNDEGTMARFKKYLLAEVDEKRSTLPLAGYCFMTGIINAIIFSAIFIWCGSQTGNTVQLALAMARLLEHDYSFHLVDKQALCSLISFICGGFGGARLGDKIGCKSRAWLFMGTFIQALFTMASAILMWNGRESNVADARDAPAWSDTLSFLFTGFLSASMGLQGVMARRVNSHFSATVALTATWCDLISNPKLFDVRRLVPSRDHQIMTIACFVAGGFVGRALLDKIGSANTLGIGTGIRVVIAVLWLFVPEKESI